MQTTNDVATKAPIEAEGFDPTTARLIARRVGGSYHDAWADAQDNVCLVCISKMGGGGVAVGLLGVV